MSEAAAFLAAIREDPDDDAPRLVFADWLDEQAERLRHIPPDPNEFSIADPATCEAESLTARAEFIRVQCELAVGTDEIRRQELRAREAALLGTWFSRWRADLPDLSGFRWGAFERGFVERIEVTDLSAFAPSADRIFALTPIRIVRVSNLNLVGLRRLAAMPQLACVSVLDLSDNMLGDEAIGILADSPHLRKLKSLRLAATAIDDPGARALAAVDWPRLRQLDLSRNEIADEGAVALARSTGLAGLERLDLSENAVDDAGAMALAGSPHLAGLDRLDLRGNDLTTDGLAALTAAPLAPHVIAPFPPGHSGEARRPFPPSRRRTDPRRWGVFADALNLLWNGALVGALFGLFAGGIVLVLSWMTGMTAGSEPFLVLSVAVSLGVGLASALLRLADGALSRLAALPLREVIGLALAVGIGWGIGWWSGDGLTAAASACLGVVLAWLGVGPGGLWWVPHSRPPRWRGPPRQDALLAVQALAGAVAGLLGGLLGGPVHASPWGVVWSAFAGLVVGLLFAFHVRILFEVAVLGETNGVPSPAETLDDNVFALAASGGGAAALLFAGFFLDGLPDLGPATAERARPAALLGALLGGMAGGAVACGRPHRRFRRLKAALLFRQRVWWVGMPIFVPTAIGLLWLGGRWLSAVESPVFLRGHDATVTAVELSPDGTRAASGAEDGTVILWDMVARHEERRFAVGAGRIAGLSWSADGRWLAVVGGDGTVRVHDPTETLAPRTLRLGDGRLTCVAFASDGRPVTGADDGLLFVWPNGDGGPGLVARTNAERLPITAVAVVGNVSALAALPTGRLIRLSLVDGTVSDEADFPVTGLTSTRGGVLAAGPGGLREYAADGELLRETQPRSPAPAYIRGPGGLPVGVRLHPTAVLSDAETGRTLRHYPYAFGGLDVSLDGTRLLAGVGTTVGWLPWPAGP